ncbi:MAG: hypothetical protein K2O97_12370 [Acetatifactor sp.]|nr:hypothetical protein [Acetatifactor sp.]MDE7045783.1 hypothetical protein [Acetatifactor sp.]
MRRKNILKLTAATLAVIGAGTFLFSTAAETVMAANAGQVETVPTSYQISGYRASANMAEALPEHGRKEGMEEDVNYQVSMDSLNTGTPTDMDLTMEEAAEAGARYLRTLYGLDLEGAYVYMSYNPGTETFPRAFWTGSVLFEKERTPESTRWTYMVDAVTGELFNSSHDRHLDANPSLGPDAALAKDYSIYAELAGEKAEECGLLNGSVDRVEYNCQGYSGNDPTVAVDVIGEKGEIVTMSFSRYDQAFLGIITDTSRRIRDSALDEFVGEVETMTYSQYEQAQ